MTDIIPREMTPEEEAERAVWAAGEHQRIIDDVNELRRSAYQLESDPIFFQWQRGEDGMTQEAWLNKIAEINERYPYPEAPSD